MMNRRNINAVAMGVTSVVNSSEYEIALAKFGGMSSTEEGARRWTDLLFVLAEQTEVNAMELLDSFDSNDKTRMTLTLAYYLNSASNSKVLYGVDSPLQPNYFAQRNSLV
jgi:glutamine synthetase adenylyltransferase